MRFFNNKVITIVAFWLLTGLMVFSLPIEGNTLQDFTTSNQLSEDKINLAQLEKH